MMKSNQLEDVNLKVRTLVEVLIVPIVAFGVYLLRDMNSNLQDLNTKVAVILAKEPDTIKRLDSLEVRLINLELKGIK